MTSHAMYSRVHSRAVALYSGWISSELSWIPAVAGMSGGKIGDNSN